MLQSLHIHMSGKKYAIVTDGLWRKSLSVIRSLGKAGYSLTVLGDSNLTIGFWSRYTSRRVICQTASTDPKAFGEALMNELKNPMYTSNPILFPMEDPTMMWLSENRKRVVKLADFIIPDEESLNIAEDKGKTMALAQKINIEHPKTFQPSNTQEAWKYIQSDIDTPFVIKPINGTGSAGIEYVTDVSHVSKKSIERRWEQYGPCIIQERIPEEGDALGVNMIYDNDSKLVGYFLHKRLQQYPNTGGPSTDRISIEDKELLRDSRKILDSLSWKGVAMIEWKVDPVSGKKKLLEINPRFWGSLELATRSGIDFPILYSKLAQSKTIDARKTNYVVGTRCRWLIPGDILRYITMKKSSRESIGTFLSGLPQHAEEWDIHDIPGCLSVIFCTGLLALQPRYWKYVRR